MCCRASFGGEDLTDRGELGKIRGELPPVGGENGESLRRWGAFLRRRSLGVGLTGSVGSYMTASLRRREDVTPHTQMRRRGLRGGT